MRSPKAAADAAGYIGVRLWSGQVREWRRNKDAPGKSFLNGMQEVTHNAGLQDVSCGAGSQACQHKIGVGMNRQENDLCSAA